MVIREHHVREVKQICQRLGIEPSDLADAAGINRETMRKYVGGYQPIPDDKMAALRLVEENRRLQGGRTKEDSPPYRITSVSVELMPDGIIQALLDVFTSKLKDTQGAERQKYFQAANSLMQEQDRRAAPAAEPKLEGKGLTDDLKATALAGRDISEQLFRSENPRRPRSYKAASPSDSKSAPGPGAPKPKGGE